MWGMSLKSCLGWCSEKSGERKVFKGYLFHYHIAEGGGVRYVPWYSLVSVHWIGHSWGQKKPRSSKPWVLYRCQKNSALTLFIERRRCEMWVTQLIAYVSGRINTELRILKIWIIGRILKEHLRLYWCHCSPPPISPMSKPRNISLKQVFSGNAGEYGTTKNC